MAASKDRDRLSERLRVDPGSSVDLGTFDPSETFGWKREDAEAEQQQYEDKLTDLQERMWAEGKHSLLIVLQGIDAAGKDGTIRHVMDAFNPQGCDVVGFKAPTPQEERHDFLWRVHPHAPGKGSVAIFNRSHYEDVIIVRVHGLVPTKVWRGRYRSINDWERMLSDEGTTILKFFLAIDKDEQRRRFQERVDDPTKRWKFHLADIEERKFWDAYRTAFEEMLAETSTDYAPWHLIPANHNWLRNLAVSEIVADAIDELNPQYPAAATGIEGLKVV